MPTQLREPVLWSRLLIHIRLNIMCPTMPSIKFGNQGNNCVPRRRATCRLNRIRRLSQTLTSLMARIAERSSKLSLFSSLNSDGIVRSQ